MSREIVVVTEVDGMHDNIVLSFFVSNDATDEYIEQEAKELAFELISWSYEEREQGKSDEDYE